MKPILEKWSLVVVGKWNTSILSPKWVNEFLFQAGNSNITVLFPIVGGLPPKYSKDSIEIAVSEDRIIFAPLRNEDALLQKMEDIAVRLLSTLSYTPISAFGENFHFEIEENEAPSILKGSFTLKDNEPLEKFGLLKQTSIKRSIVEGDRTLNFTVENGNAGNSFSLMFNCHYAANDAQKAASLMQSTFLKNRNHVLDILNSVYKLTSEEGDLNGQ